MILSQVCCIMAAARHLQILLMKNFLINLPLMHEK